LVAPLRVRPEHAANWAELTASFTEAVRAEPGCLWFDWSRSVDDPNEFVLIEAFRDAEAGAAHVQSDHFLAARHELPPLLVETPRVVNMSIPQDDWSELSEMAVESSGD
jgi:quinol monooxygenase YgiN